MGQVNETWEAKEERMKKYLSKVKHCITAFTKVEFIQVLSEENTEVDRLAKAASADGVMDEQVKIQYFSSIDIPKVQ